MFGVMVCVINWIFDIWIQHLLGCCIVKGSMRALLQRRLWARSTTLMVGRSFVPGHFFDSAQSKTAPLVK